MTFQSTNFIMFLRVLQTFQKLLASPTNVIKLFAASLSFIKVVCESHELCKVVGEFCELCKIDDKFYKLCKVVCSSMDFVKGWFCLRYFSCQIWQADIFKKPLHNNHFIKWSLFTVFLYSNHLSIATMF